MSKILEVKVNIDGLYGMGLGFLTMEQYRQWNNFWHNLATAKNAQGRQLAIFWKVNVEHNHLYCTAGGGYLHPMDGMHCFLPYMYGGDFKSEVNELISIFSELAKVCKCECKVLTQEHFSDVHFLNNLSK